MADKQEKDRVMDDDGCYYMTEEEAKAFSKMAKPPHFDPAVVKNHKVDVPYGALPEQLLDIYLPESGEGPFPVVFYVHGGGWRIGSKTDSFMGGIIGLIDYGYAVLSVDYRLAPKTIFPEFLFDVKTAVRWARAHAAEYKFDPNRFAMIGDSAGGHLALMIAFTTGRPEYADESYGWPGVSDEVQAICDMYGVSLLTDSTRFFRESGVPRVRREKPGESHWGTLFGTDHEDLLRLISPISLVHKNIPPVLILQGMKDGAVAYQQSTLLADKISEVCGKDRVKLILYEDRNHADFGFNTKENSDEIAAFFDSHL
ncbi:MAG: alpha/beta hydrolase [Peptococcaceae bacterium]|jgi:acetyl esterase/lipase|nr:alpha/beta hydrolase [Peptococcaceae bacterium]